MLEKRSDGINVEFQRVSVGAGNATPDASLHLSEAWIDRPIFFQRPSNEPRAFLSKFFLGNVFLQLKCFKSTSLLQSSLRCGRDILEKRMELTKCTAAHLKKFKFSTLNA